LNLAETSVVKSRPSVPHGANNLFHFIAIYWQPVYCKYVTAAYISRQDKNDQMHVILSQC